MVRGGFWEIKQPDRVTRRSSVAMPRGSGTRRRFVVRTSEKLTFSATQSPAWPRGRFSARASRFQRGVDDFLEISQLERLREHGGGAEFFRHVQVKLGIVREAAGHGDDAGLGELAP